MTRALLWMGAVGLPIACAASAPPPEPVRAEPRALETRAPAPSPEPAASSAMIAADPAPIESASVEPPQNSSPCSGAFYDIDKVPTACAAPAGAQSFATPGAFTVRIAPLPPVKRGETLALDVELVNTSTSDAELVFKPACAHFEAEAYRNGKRADLIEIKCATGSGCGGALRRIVLAPNGTIQKYLTLETIVRKERAGDCEQVTVGPMAHGR
jgi:hypothetical protein